MLLSLDQTHSLPPLRADAQQVGGNIYASDLTFRDLDLSPEILDALLLDMKFERPSKIQALTLPRILSQPDRHMIAQGHNGCGKTTCFTLAMLMRCVYSLALELGAGHGARNFASPAPMPKQTYCVTLNLHTQIVGQCTIHLVATLPSFELDHIWTSCRVNPEISRPQAICICPTRELVIQNQMVLKKMAARTNPPITARATSDPEQRRCAVACSVG